MAVFKVNIYPLIYWGLAYGLIAGFVLFVLFLLSKYITVIWFPVFLGGLIWGGYRNYKKQKDGWSKQSNEPKNPKSVVEEVKEATSDIFSAAKELVAEQLKPEEGAADGEAVVGGEQGEAVAQEQGVVEKVPVVPQTEQPAPPKVEIEQTEAKKPEPPEQPKPPV